VDKRDSTGRQVTISIDDNDDDGGGGGWFMMIV